MPQTPERKREWAARRREQRRAFAYAHLGGVCCKCGATSELEIDHVDRGSKIANVSALWTNSEQSFIEELGKCQLLCRPCHQDKSVEEQYPERQHGSIAMYSRGKCRCTACRTAWNEYHRRYR